jgi:hypothetical protein
MGAASSTIKSVEVSFVDKNTGKWLSEREIHELNQKVFKEFDYKPSFYDAYKIDKFGNNPYAECAKYLEANRRTWKEVKKERN